jgi:hypothetical protein
MALVLGSAPVYNRGGKDLNGELGQRIDRLLTDNPVDLSRKRKRIGRYWPLLAL